MNVAIRWPRAIPVVAILAATLLLMLPLLVRGHALHDSFWIDWVWSDQFSAELALGHLYPRWLPEANGGSGSPTFYFYPPLAFYISGVLGLLGLTTYQSIIGCFAIALAASGFAMFAWLKDSPRRLFGTLLFMAAPYHLLDFYIRGAQAEFVAIAIIPLIALGMKRAEQKKPTLLALSYAALILAHLPLALLTSLFFIAPDAIWRHSIRSSLVPLAIGLLLASIYLIPAIALDHLRHRDLLWANPAYQPANWNLIFPHEGPRPGMRNVFGAVLAALLIPVTVLWFAGRRAEAAYAVACCLIAAGIVPGLWSLPLIKDVQFPFRMLPLAEFALATGVASIRLSGPMSLCAALPTLVITPALMAAHPHDVAPPMAWLASYHPDVAENRLIVPGSLPAWPEQLGLLLSLTGLCLLVAFSLRGRLSKGRPLNVESG